MSGRWIFDAQHLVLDFVDANGRWIYDVDLERCRTSAEVLDWIIQVRKKQWACDAVLADLIRQLDDVLDLQSSTCGCGRERGPIDVKKWLGEAP